MKRPNYEFHLETYFERIADYIFCRSPEYEIQERGFASNGMGDLGTRTGLFAICLQDVELMLACISLIRHYKRWPDWCEPGRKERKRLAAAGFKRFRGQRSMTRDPYKYCLIAIAQQKQLSESQKRSFYKQVRIPFWINRLPLWLFKRALLNPKWQPIFERVKIIEINWRNLWEPKRKIWLKKKEEAKSQGQGFRQWIFDSLHKSFGFAGFHKHQMAWQLYVTDSKKAQAKLCLVTPHWNYVLMLLCNKPTLYLAGDFIENYKGQEGYIWSADKWETRKAIPVDEPLKQDEQVLKYLWGEWKIKN